MEMHQNVQLLFFNYLFCSNFLTILKLYNNMVYFRFSITWYYIEIKYASHNQVLRQPFCFFEHQRLLSNSNTNCPETRNASVNYMSVDTSCLPYFCPMINTTETFGNHRGDVTLNIVSLSSTIYAVLRCCFNLQV